MSQAQRGRFITLEGGEGAGKTTQLRLLAEWLAARGVTVVTTREPGGTPGAEAVRRLLVEGREFGWSGVSELLLFLAARRDHLEKVIWPALARGDWVISDRFQDSTAAYQGAARGVDMGYAGRLYREVCGPFLPDLTLVLDLDPAVGLARARQAADRVDGDRFEAEALAFHARLRDGFLAIAEREPERCVVVTADGVPEEIHERIRAVISARFGIADLR